MAPRVRRVVLWLVAGAVLARLYVFGNERGWEVVGPVTVRVTAVALAAWLAHMVLHELAHWVMARRMDFEVHAVRFGPLRLQLLEERAWEAGEAPIRPGLRWGGLDLGGGVSSSPRGTERLRQRLRAVALAGPAATLATTALTALWYLAAGSPGLGSPLGIVVVLGGFVFVTSLLPGVLLPKALEAGSDLDQILQSRRVLGHWTHAAVLEGAERGRRVSETVSRELAESLLPPLGHRGEPEPVELMWTIVCFEAGDFAAPRARLEAALAALREAQRRSPGEEPDWLHTDFHAQAGALFALVDGDAPRAEACLVEVRRFAELSWYGDLLEACVAQARGEPERRDAMLASWRRHVAEHPRGVFALSGNQWIVAELERRGAR